MAFSNTAAGGEYVSAGAMGARGLYSTKRKYSLSDEIVYQNRGDNLFDNILRMELRTITVDDPEPKLLTKQEAPIKFDVHSDGTTSAGGIDEDTLRISDTEAKFLQANDVLMCNNIFCDSDGANYATTKYNTGYSAETMIVSTVTLSGAASGIANVVVKRGNGYQPSSSVTTVLTEYKLIRLGNAFEDGFSAPTAIWHEPTAIQNYCQLFSKTWQETETESNMNIFGKETMPKKAVRKRKEFFREIDAALLFGRKGRHVINGQHQWTTGGIVEYIPYNAAGGSLDATNRYIDFGGAFNMQTWREKAEIIFRYGSQEKTLFCGGKFFTVLYNNLEKFIVMNDGLTKKWGWHVYDIETGHGLMHLLRHPILRELDTSTSEWAYDAIVVDLQYVELMKMKGMDVKIKTGVEENDEHQKKNEIYAQLGLRRSHPSAHAVIYGITG